LSAFNNLTGNSGCNPWQIGRGTFDVARRELVAEAALPLIDESKLAGGDIAFVADPFHVTVGGTTFILAEAWSKSAQRGRIAAFELGADDRVVHSAIVLAEAFHLSYPCVFECAGSYYMLPEAWESGNLILYKALAFPWRWQCESILLTLDYADPQIFFDGDICYLFLNTDPLSNSSLSVFWSKSLTGEWRSHPKNPVLDGNPLLARSAGPLYYDKGRLLRFSQDCRKTYGRDVFVSEITKLSPTEFSCEPIGPVLFDRPPWARSAFHHLHIFGAGGRTLFDGYTAAAEPSI
jgi:hypothetical protein